MGCVHSSYGDNGGWAMRLLRSRRTSNRTQRRWDREEKWAFENQGCRGDIDVGVRKFGLGAQDGGERK